MADVVKVPVIGNVKTPWLYAGGAAVVGIAAYAWWTRAGITETEDFAVELPATEFEPPTVVDSGINVGGAGGQGEPIARTNVEWRNMAQAEGEALGFSQVVMQSALTKYLGKDRLGATEAAAMSAVVAILGQPPTGGPYSIMLSPIEPPPPHAPAGVPGTVTGLAYVGPVIGKPGFHQLVWNRVDGADRYLVTGQTLNAAGQPSGGSGPAWPEESNSHQAHIPSNTNFRFEVRAQNASGTGPPGVVTFRT